jgi:RNase H-fold protein (predicted Holliday junction resolvase)
VETGRIGVYDDGKNSKSRPAAFRRKQDAGRVEGTQKRRIDALAAAEILQAFLDEKRSR